MDLANILTATINAFVAIPPAIILVVPFVTIGLVYFAHRRAARKNALLRKRPVSTNHRG